LLGGVALPVGNDPTGSAFAGDTGGAGRGTGTVVGN
jgi:hypothetical protein